MSSSRSLLQFNNQMQLSSQNCETQCNVNAGRQNKQNCACFVRHNSLRLNDLIDLLYINKTNVEKISYLLFLSFSRLSLSCWLLWSAKVSEKEMVTLR